MQAEPRRPQRQDTYDLREQIHPDDQQLQAHAEAAMNYGTDEEEHSILEDDSEQEEAEEIFDEDDMSSTLSIPNESIDFDMVYALHSFAATVEGQANVVKGDSLFLMDDSNSYWWLVRVLKTQEVGYIPAENIETPFERLARLNKHRNVDLASATQAEQQESLLIAQERLRNNISSRTGSNHTPSPLQAGRNTSRYNSRRNVHFNSVRSHHRYVPPLRDGEIEDEEDEWDTDGFEDEDLDLAADQMYMQSMDEDDSAAGEMEDGIMWDEAGPEEMQNRQAFTGQGPAIPESLQPGSLREQQQQQMLRAQQLQQVQQQELLAQQQRQQQEQQLLQQQQQQREVAQQASRQQAQIQVQPLRPSNSQDQVVQEASTTQGQPARRIDPAEATETRKMTVTPTIAREYDERAPGQPYLPSSIIDDERKRSRDDDGSDDSSKKKAKSKDKMAAPVSSATYNKQQPAKLRKDPGSRGSISGGETTDDEGKDKKKKGSVFGGLFGRGKKEKPKETTKSSAMSIGSIESSEYAATEDSSRSGRASTSDGATSPTTTAAQQQQQAISLRNTSIDIRAAVQVDQSAPHTPERSTGPQVSTHASQLRQKDQQQQALYQQYLNRSPSSPPDAQLMYGLQSAASVMLSSPSSSSALGPPTPRPRPGSLILTSPSAINDIQANLSVIRVFAGRQLQTEATFKTVLLNSTTTASDLVRQALQRFRLPSAEDENDYYLTVKQVEGGAFAVLEPNENPLVVFEALVNEAMELPKVKRSSVGSISSISSNLSMHPAIKKLSMNDFTDDSAVKFYLNRRGDGIDESMNGHEGDDTIIADTSHGESEMMSPQKSQFLNIGSNATSERFSSPSIRFALQVVIYADDLPDDMQFHPSTEAIVAKNSLTDPNMPVTVSPNLRRKIFMFPKNVTVAEVTEIGLERFGIQDGVVDGGDEIEDKTTKRRSGVRVRYGLTVSIDGHERELAPSSKVIDAFPRPPQYRNPERQTGTNKRRSLDPSQLYGSLDDIRPDDPAFVLRRATSYRNSTSRRRFSAPLDEIALQHLHRESTSSYSSDAPNPTAAEEVKLKQPSRQEIIAAQRAAQRANQRAMVSAQTNSVRGMDVLLPGNVVLRSSRYDVGDRMRYSYVEPDGETYDISDIIEEEWREISTSKNDLLEGVFIRNKDGIGEKLDRVLNKIKKGKGKERDYSSVSSHSTDGRPSSTRSISPSEYSDDPEGRSRSATPGSAAFVSKMPNGTEPLTTSRATPVAADGRTSRPGTVTPTAGLRNTPPSATHTPRNPSIASVMSNQSDRSTPQKPSNLSRVEEERVRATPRSQQRRVVLPKDDFGISHMMAIIDYKASKPKTKEPPPQHPVDELLFGKSIDLESLHPQIRDIYASGFKQLEEIDKVLDTYIGRSVVGAF